MQCAFNLYRAIVMLLFIIVSCDSKKPVTGKELTGEESGPAVINPADTIPQQRKEIKKEAIASYKEKTDNPLNDWYFRVNIFETPNTFQYLVKLEFEEIRGTDTLKLPNFGTFPEPVIQKGPEKYSCIIGFLDKNKKFREYKKVYVKNNTLKVTAIKHYSVATYKKQ